jgi:conjugal transfer mating pair stabilization protein TraN
VVPGYTTTPPERGYYGQPNLSGQTSARLAACATTPNDPVCQALLGARASANTPREPVSPYDPAVLDARRVAANPSTALEDIASYYSGCQVETVATPATETRVCRQYSGATAQSCARTLSVSISRTSSCPPGEWFAQAASGSVALGVQCKPDQPASGQRFRVTNAGVPVAFFDVDVGSGLVFPQMVAVLETSYSGMTGLPIRTGVWVANKSCAGSIAAESLETCTGGGDSGYSCTSVEPFLKVYAACRAGTQSGDNIQDTVCNPATAAAPPRHWMSPSATRRLVAGRPMPAST